MLLLHANLDSVDHRLLIANVGECSGEHIVALLLLDYLIINWSSTGANRYGFRSIYGILLFIILRTMCIQTTNAMDLYLRRHWLRRNNEVTVEQDKSKSGGDLRIVVYTTSILNRHREGKTIFRGCRTFVCIWEEPFINPCESAENLITL